LSLILKCGSIFTAGECWLQADAVGKTVSCNLLTCETALRCRRQVLLVRDGDRQTCDRSSK